MAGVEADFRASARAISVSQGSFLPFCLNKVFKHQGCLIGDKIAKYHNKITNI